METAGSNTTININDGNANGDANFGILFGSEADLGAGVADTVYVDGATDNYGLSYNPNVTSVSHASEGSEAVGNNNAAGLFSKFGFAGDLAGTATSAKYVETTNAGTDARPTITLLGPPQVKRIAKELTFTEVLSMKLRAMALVTSPLTVTSLLLVPQQKLRSSRQRFKLLTEEYFSLTQTGLQLTQNQLQAAFDNKGIGIVIDNAAQGEGTADDNLAKFVYLGHKDSTNFQNSASVLGWKVAQESNNTASTAVATEGVATMRVGTTPGGDGVATYTMTTGGGVDTINIGIGAMYYGGTGNGGGLWIQTGV